MCYSAQILADYRRYVKDYGAELDIREFVELFWHRVRDPRVKIPKVLDAAFMAAADPATREIPPLIAEFAQQQRTQWEQELFGQRKRLADAQRSLAAKPTKKAAEELRIATAKIAWCQAKLADLHRTELTGEDARIFPQHYAPVMVWEAGRRVVKPMRYQCRPAGKPASHDQKFPGTYNARRDNLEGFWKGQFGVTHGLVAMSAFYENVPRHRAEGRELGPGEKAENVVLEFRPRPAQEMLVACLWSRWESPQGTLLSFAAITDEPPPEIAAAGHDRCVIPIRARHIDAWLRPDARRLAQQQAILDDRERPYFEHAWPQAA